MTHNDRWWREDKPQTKKQRNVSLEFEGNDTVAIFALVTSIIGLILSFTLFGVIFCVAGVLLANSALSRGHRGIGIASMVMSLVGLAMALLVVVALATL